MELNRVAIVGLNRVATGELNRAATKELDRTATVRRNRAAKHGLKHSLEEIDRMAMAALGETSHCNFSRNYRLRESLKQREIGIHFNLG